MGLLNVGQKDAHASSKDLANRAKGGQPYKEDL